jgi:hypothetical protein
MNKISIKEAGRYSNFLSSKIEEMSNIPYDEIESKLEKITEFHKKSSANPNAKDKIIEVKKDDAYDVGPKRILEVIKEMIEEKVNLAMAISLAKADNFAKVEEKEMDIDSAIEYSKQLRRLASNFFYPLMDRENRTIKETSNGYAFNVEGNQVPYIYEVDKTIELLYDKKVFIKEKKELLLLADKLSAAVEKVMSSDIVEFTPKYNYLDSTKDILEG